MKKSLPLPPSMAAAIQAIRWPLDPSSSQQLSLEPLERLSEIRSKARKNEPALPILNDIPATITSLASGGDRHSALLDPTDQRHHCIISIALVLLGNGYADEAHSLVTPLSWPTKLPHGYGEPVIASLSAEALASYTHSLVHRREAFHVGEYGQDGFQNSDFWISNAFRTVCADDTLPLERITHAILETARGNPAAEEWCKENSVTDESAALRGWDPRALNELCRRVMREDEGAAQLKGFAERAAEVELRVLLSHTLKRAGYELPHCLTRSAEAV